MSNSSSPNQLSDPLPRKNERVRLFDTLLEDEKKALARRGITEEWLARAEQTIRELITTKSNSGTLYGTTARQDAATQLGVDVSTIHRMVEAYDPNKGLDSFVPKKRGAPRGQRLTDEQKCVICSLYLAPIKVQISEQTVVPGRSTIRYIHDVLTMFYPPQVSEDTVRRYIYGIKNDHALLVLMARRGENYIRDRIMPTPSVNPERPNEVWILDARPLPIYVKHNGIIVIPALLLIVDQKSHYPIRARLIPRSIVGKDGKIKRADVKSEDVGIVLASAIHTSQIRPDKLYTDNGSSIVGVGELFADLSANGDVLSRFVRSIPGRPRGRGPIELMLYAFDRMLKDLPANMVPDDEDPNKKDHFTLMRNAKQATNMLDLEGPNGLQGHIDTFIETLRDEPKREHGRHTRRQLWTATGSLRAFPIRELMRLLPKDLRVERDAAIDNYKIVFRRREHGDDYEPRLDSDQDWDKWLEASARPEHVPLRAMKIDTGWTVEVCLDRDPTNPYWCELILKERQTIDESYRMERINSSLRGIRTQYTEMAKRLANNQEQTGLANIVKLPGKGPVLRANNEQQEDYAIHNKQEEQSTSQEQNKAVSEASVGQSNVQQGNEQIPGAPLPSGSVSVSVQPKHVAPVPPKRSKKLDVAALMREAEEDMRP